MPVSSRDVEKVIEIIADKEELKVTVNSSVRGGLTAGIATVIGGLFLGPPGLAIGGVVGGTLAYATSKEFKPVSEVFRSLDRHQKDKLILKVTGIIGDMDVYDYLTLLRFLNGDGGWIRQRIIRSIIKFLQDELKLTTT